MKVNGENFILTFIKDGLAYPVVLNEEQKVAFDIAIRFILVQFKLAVSL